jgi:phosphatidylinositol-3-phosphatase
MKLAAFVACALVVALPAAAAPAVVPSFDHVVVIVFENKESSSVRGNQAAPAFNSYARRYATMTRYFAVAHPSLPNYLALVSGSTHGISSNCTDCVVDAPSLADTLDTAGLSWKTYAEGLPVAGFMGARSGRYAKKHNPFLYFRSVAASPSRRAQVVPLTELRDDLLDDLLPDFALVVPDLCSSMHDCSVSVGDRWLRRTVPPLLRLGNTAVFVLFDEGTSRLRGGGHVPALVLGTAVRPKSRYQAVVNHYAVLRTIEEAWSLPLLARSAQARPITGLWR